MCAIGGEAKPTAQGNALHIQKVSRPSRVASSELRYHARLSQLRETG